MLPYLTLELELETGWLLARNLHRFRIIIPSPPTQNQHRIRYFIWVQEQPNKTSKNVVRLLSISSRFDFKDFFFYRNTMKPDYDLVRTHHPDSSHARLSSTHNAVEAHSRFRSIKAAYDFLRGRTLSPDPNSTPPPSPRNFDPYMHEMARRRRAYNASRDNFGKTEWTEGFGAPKQEREEWNDNGTKERLLLLFGVVVCVLISYCFLIDIEQKNISFSLKKYIGTGGRFIPQSSEDIHLYNLPYVGPSIVHIPILPLRVIRSTCLLPVVNISFRPI